jgi:hypothetical protein
MHTAFLNVVSFNVAKYRYPSSCMATIFKNAEFYQWGQQQLQTDQIFFQNVLLAVEATFTDHGQTNTINVHCWTSGNLR